MDFKKDFFRLNEWWNVKVSLFFGIFTMYALHYKIDFIEYGSIVIECFLVFFPIAAWANVVNDFGDIESDKLANKPNRLATWSKTQQVLLTFGFVPLLFIVPQMYGYPFQWYLFIGLTILAFYLYSVKPFRFKSDGWKGVFMDALATQVFPMLFIIQRIQSEVKQENLLVFVPLAIWLLASGLRLHMVHQYMDVENDKRAGLKTLFTSYEKPYIDKVVSRIIFPIEIVFFVINLMVLQQYWFVFALLIYGIVQFLLKRNFKIKHSLYAVNQQNRIILSEYYNYYILFFSLLIASIYISSMYLIPLISFMILFFYSYWPNLKELLHILRTYSQNRS